MVFFGCGGSDPGASAFKATDITGVGFGRDFDLTDHNGRRRTLADFRGRLVVIFFGYTNCPDACPTTLADLSLALKKLGSDAASVQVLFITIDPERDTPQLLVQYVPAFNPSFLGLYGDAEETTKVAKEFKVVYAKYHVSGSDSYVVDHSTGSYVFDQHGKLRLYLPQGFPPDAIAHDLGLLLKSVG